MRHKLAIYLVGAAGLATTAFFIWPTPYREYRVGESWVRVHRLTGKTDVLRPWGWQPAARPK
jgi:hypothetical protein